MPEETILEQLRLIGVWLTGDHFVFTSGRHSSEYVDKDIAYAHPRVMVGIGALLAQAFLGDQVDVVVGPALGGIALSQWVGHQLNNRTRGDEILVAYAEKVDGRFVIKRGYEKLIPGKRILVVEDILTTGGSAAEVIDVVRKLEGKVIGLGALWNRGGVTAAQVGNVPKLVSLINRELPSWSEEECKQTGPCSRGVTVNIMIGKGGRV